MRYKKEERFLRFLTAFGILSFFNLIRKPPSKDWLLIFLLKSYISSFVDTIVVRKGYIKYPANLLKSFDISVVFSYLLFPITCVYYNQITKESNLQSIILKGVLFSLPMALFEDWLEKNTKLIRYKKSWNWLYSFISIFCTFILVRGLYRFIHHSTINQNVKQ
ncbi:CBO0543 family protein [Bacillus suaedaesalsae]|uniref:CBO0543 family protein n=1 Tax=Bacillus suaedaesalsae TaxID=2810349 RepID=UPI0024B521D1|nr:CBO0543 family protein [Bacillus suaedaesalsae]